MEKHFLLGDVSEILGRKPHQIVHLLTTRAIPEPEHAHWESASLLTR